MCWFSPQMAVAARAGSLAGARSLQLGLPRVTVHCFPRCVHVELDWKWKDWGLS